MTSTSSAGSSVMGGYYRRALQTVNIGFTLPFRDTLFSWLLALWSSAGRQQEREARPGEEPEKPTLSSARAQSTVWAAQGKKAARGGGWARYGIQTIGFISVAAAAFAAFYVFFLRLMSLQGCWSSIWRCTHDRYDTRSHAGGWRVVTVWLLSLG